MILEVKYLNEKRTSFLLTCDIETEGENILLKNALLKHTDILKVAHHGSKGSTTKVFLEAVYPKWAIISCSKENSYGHPHKEVLERLKNENINYLSTANKGAVIVHVDDQTYTIYAYKTEIRNRESD
jgi:competence protein ComEC